MKIIFYIIAVCSLVIKDSVIHEVIPLHYDLYFQILPDKFKGTTKIHFKSLKNTEKITLDVENLDIESVKLGKSELNKNNIVISKSTAVIVFNSQILADSEYILEVDYQGKYSTEIDGIYKSNYNNNTIYSTHFEATYARKAFPCFDRPDLKSTFAISISGPENYTVLSNSSLSSVENNTHIFTTTKPMSTYLVAFVVGIFEYDTITTENNIEIKVYADKSDVKNAKLALNVAKNALSFYEKYFDMRYPFPKLDLISIPEFAMGAMENWGLVTFRKTSLLFDPLTDSTSSKMLVIDTVCHELAHMWFGNLVTMRWWNDLWLNEGFATWASTMAIYNLPDDIVDFDVWSNFINTTLEDGMQYDALQSSHPVAVEVKDPHEINEIFDHISYNKGASFIRMIENYVGHDTFRKGIQKYMREFQYQNAESNDFFAIQNNYKLADLSKPWLNKTGFPLIKVEETDDSIVLTQSRFLSCIKTTDDTHWTIPITIKFGSDKTKKILLTTKRTEIPKENTIYKLNISNVGFYRVQYSLEMFKNIFEYYSSNKERLNIINDFFALGLANYINISSVLEFFNNLDLELNYELLKSVISNSHTLCHIYYNDEKQYTYIKQMISKFISKQIKNIYLTDELKNENRLLNSLVLSNAVFLDNIKILELLQEHYKSFKNQKQIACPDFMYAMFRAVVDDDIDEIINLAKTSKIVNVKISAIRALGTVKEKKNIEKVLRLYNELDRQDLSIYYSGLSSNIKYKKLIAMYFMENFAEIKAYINNSSLFNSSMSFVLGGHSDIDLVKSVEKFLENFDKNLTTKKILENNNIFLQYKIANPKLYQ